MSEETVWRGTSSQWKNLGPYVLCGFFCWLIVPIFIALWCYLQTKNKIYELTTERLKITEGVFSKITDTLELYRVKDHRNTPAISLQNIPPRKYRREYFRLLLRHLFLLEAIPSAVGFADKMRNQVEVVRMQKRVREIDIE